MNTLQLEITESMLMQDVLTNVATLQQLRAMGVSLALDDFGTDYSSLSYLRLFPMDTLKIDKSFVDGLGKNPQDQAVLEAMISLARSFGMTTIAEGVETTQQSVLLQELECAKVQGFLFARPLPPEGVAPLLHHTFDLAAETQPSPAQPPPEGALGCRSSQSKLDVLRTSIVTCTRADTRVM